ncbi:MAG TPA: hypothetical protein VGC89_12835 [Pyrinomonadaceae bacterium]|jgi:hypothetical protein
MSPKDDLTIFGAIGLRGADRPYSPEELSELQSLCEAIPLERGKVGYDGEDPRVEIGRIKLDPVDLALADYPGEGERRQIVNKVAAERIMHILAKPQAMQYWTEMLSLSRAFIRRAQVNVLRVGGYISPHIDAEANPDYVATVIIGLSDAFSGGDYIVHQDSGPRAFRLDSDNMLVNLNHITHEVTPVISGARRTLVFFLATHEHVSAQAEVGR